MKTTGVMLDRNNYCITFEFEPEDFEKLVSSGLKPIMDVSIQDTSKTKKVSEIACTCYACPSQWEGMLQDGSYLYIRYRWGYLRVDVGDETIFGAQFGDDLDGMMNYKQMVERTKSVLDFSECSFKEDESEF